MFDIETLTAEQRAAIAAIKSRVWEDGAEDAMPSEVSLALRELGLVRRDVVQGHDFYTLTDVGMSAREDLLRIA